jgi:hypothetical protein
MFKKTTIAAAITISTSVLLVACGGSGDHPGTVVTSPPAPTTLQGTPTTTAALSAAQFNGALSSSPSGTQLIQAAGAPKCGVTVSHIQYSTTGAAGENTISSGAVMVPTGTDPSCTGARPIVLYAHGTTAIKSYNMAALLDTTNAASGETTLVAATFAAQGYIVIAPNLAGYDTSTLPYHPYVLYKQNSQEMIDALNAGRAALANTSVSAGDSDSGKLFVTGYSEGGYVAMATLKAMQAQQIPVTAGAPMSGPYSLGAYVDAVFYGNTALGATLFAPILTTGYQKAYGNIYTQPSDAYVAPFAANVENIINDPAFAASLINTSNLPGLFQSVPDPKGVSPDQFDPVTGADVTTSKFSFGFSANNYVISTAYRAAYLTDAAAHPDGAVPKVTASPLPETGSTNPLRQALAINDLRGYVPAMPLLMCGGHNDPTVFFSANAQLMAGIMQSVSNSGSPVGFALLDVDATDSGKVGFTSAGLSPTVTSNMTAASAQLMGGFAASLQAVAGSVPPAYAAAAVGAKYHGTLVPPFCTIAARTFFQQY